MKEAAARLLAECPGAEPIYFEGSEWFDDDTMDQVDSVIQEYGKHYRRRLVVGTAHLRGRRRVAHWRLSS